MDYVCISRSADTKGVSYEEDIVSGQSSDGNLSKQVTLSVTRTKSLVISWRRFIRKVKPTAFLVLRNTDIGVCFDESRGS